MALESEAGFGIYIHWPFCAAKCPYCDFNSHVRHGAVDQERFVQAFKTELGEFARQTPDRRVTSIFFGGGTPSLMKAGTVGAILDAVARYWTVSQSAEISLEANPTSVEADRFKGYAAAGVNRVSLGVQALNDPDLGYLGRRHSAQEALSALALAREIFPRLSFDLIYGRPGQRLADWKRELDQALQQAADHLSLYQLTIEPDTTFEALARAGKLNMPDADILADFYETTVQQCEDAGLPAYEISNFAAPGAECRHNLTYWRYQDYVGSGPGAHGRIATPSGRRATRCEASPEQWLDRVEQSGTGVVEDLSLSPQEAGDEMLLMGMRLREGIAPSAFQKYSGHALDPERLADLITYGMIEPVGPDRIRATAAGFSVLDAVIADLAA